MEETVLSELVSRRLPEAGATLLWAVELLAGRAGGARELGPDKGCCSLTDMK